MFITSSILLFYIDELAENYYTHTILVLMKIRLNSADSHLIMSIHARIERGQESGHALGNDDIAGRHHRPAKETPWWPA